MKGVVDDREAIQLEARWDGRWSTVDEDGEEIKMEPLESFNLFVERIPSFGIATGSCPPWPRRYLHL